MRKEGGMAELSKTQLLQGRHGVACLVPRVPWGALAFSLLGKRMVVEKAGTYNIGSNSSSSI